MPNRRLQIACAAAGLVAPLVALAALFGSGLFPPEPANRTAAEIASFYAHHGDLKIAGAFIGFCAVSLAAPLVAVIGLRLFRIEGRHPIASFVQIVSGAATVVFLSIPLLIMLVAAFRPDRAPDTTQALHDLAWILFLIPVGPFILQNTAIAVAILRDRHPRPVYPRWVAWANLVIAASFVPDALLGFFKSGAFAYQGAVAFWIPTVTYGLWLNIMAITTIRAIRAEAREDAEAAAPTEAAPAAGPPVPAGVS
ncbi:hypothetical protein SK069_16700 [Patulibacter brassicae]|uniref:DUF4386 domain-containing protein n=1 Tax=Patulibacter brassicae TaxID=1705717 RepID=A0ABU4VP73_9ACTN|nr:hypothetical protein [Patulibacter brassicae]MDX8153240.1 hypothetical protein [Patulibacter brassicae]